MLITNAPRPGEVVTQFLDKVGVPRDAYDGIVSSGDVTRAVMAERPAEVGVPHRAGARPADLRRPRPALRAARSRPTTWSAPGFATTRSRRRKPTAPSSANCAAASMFMLCGNPDLVVERGDKLIYCAGALADLYVARRRGALRRQAAPPDLRSGAARVAELRGAAPPLNRVLAIGDSVRTDLKGATDFGIDCLFVTAGIHAEELGDRHDPESGRAQPDLRRRRHRAEGGDAPAGVVMTALKPRRTPLRSCSSACRR